jgi:tetratricopeptide (TPR) repeat protein
MAFFLLFLCALATAPARAGESPDSLRELEGAVLALEADRVVLAEKVRNEAGFSSEVREKRLFEDALYAYFLEDWQRAAMGFHVLVNLGTTDGVLLQDSEWYLADSLYQLGFIEMAADEFTAVAGDARHPFRDDALERLLLLYAEHGPPEAFERTYARGRAEQRLRTNTRLTYTLGRARYVRGDVEQALGVFEQVPPASGWYVRAQYHAGVCELRLGRVLAARKRFESLSELEVETPFERWAQDLSQLAVARVLLELDDPDAASLWYLRVRPDSPVIAEARQEIAWAWIRADEPLAALDALERFRRVHPEDPGVGRTRVLTGHVFFDQALYEQAEEQYAVVADDMGRIRRAIQGIDIHDEATKRLFADLDAFPLAGTGGLDLELKQVEALESPLSEPALERGEPVSQLDPALLTDRSRAGRKARRQARRLRRQADRAARRAIRRGEDPRARPTDSDGLADSGGDAADLALLDPGFEPDEDELPLPEWANSDVPRWAMERIATSGQFAEALAVERELERQADELVECDTMVREITAVLGTSPVLGRYQEYRRDADRQIDATLALALASTSIELDLLARQRQTSRAEMTALRLRHQSISERALRAAGDRELRTAEVALARAEQRRIRSELAAEGPWSSIDDADRQALKGVEDEIRRLEALRRSVAVPEGVVADLQNLRADLRNQRERVDPLIDFRPFDRINAELDVGLDSVADLRAVIGREENAARIPIEQVLSTEVRRLEAMAVDHRRVQDDGARLWAALGSRGLEAVVAWFVELEEDADAGVVDIAWNRLIALRDRTETNRSDREQDAGYDSQTFEALRARLQ